MNTMKKILDPLCARATSSSRDMGLILALLLTCSFYSCEGKYFQQFIGLIQGCLGGLLVATFIYLSFLNGVLRRGRFLAFCVALLALPQLGLILFSSYALKKGFGRLMMDLSLVFGQWAFEPLNKLTGISVQIVAVATLMVVGAAFVAGYGLAKCRTDPMGCE